MFYTSDGIARRKSERGNALLEFALGWWVIWLLFSGCYQVGYAYYVYNVLMTSVANAAQLGSKLGYDNGNPGAYTTALQNMVVYGDEVQGAKAIVPGLTTAMVTVNVTTQGSVAAPRDVTIFINGYTIDALFAKYRLTTKPRATTAYFGQFTCSTGSDC
jgi:Flp pilus assembly protein TadG